MRAAAVAFASRSNATVRTRPRRTAARAAMNWSRSSRPELPPERATGQLHLGDQLQGDGRGTDRHGVAAGLDAPASAATVITGEQARVRLDGHAARAAVLQFDPLESEQPQPLPTGGSGQVQLGDVRPASVTDV